MLGLSQYKGYTDRIRRPNDRYFQSHQAEILNEKNVKKKNYVLKMAKIRLCSFLIKVNYHKFMTDADDTKTW